MDKEKEIEEMAKALYAPQLKKQNGGYGELCGGCRKWYEDEPCKEKWRCHFYKSIAEYLHGAGFGNVKQAVKEFADKVEDIIERHVQGLAADSDRERKDPQKLTEGIGRFYARERCLAIIREQKELYFDDQH